MKFSWWNQFYDVSFEVNVPTELALTKLSELYANKRSKRLEIDEKRKQINVEKGSCFFSAICIGPETWCRHVIEITMESLPDGKSKINFSINLKLAGFSVGKNFLLSECKSFCDKINSTS